MPHTVVLVGRPDAGVAEVFDAAVGAHVVDESRARLPRRIGTLSLPDRRLEQLAGVIGSRSVVHAELTLWEYPGRGLGFGEDADAAWVGELRAADAVAFVVRVAPEGLDSALRDAAEDIATELALWDLEVVEAARERAQERAASGPRAERREAQHSVELLDRVRVELAKSATVDDAASIPDERRELRGFALFASKPRAVLLNASDDDARATELTCGTISACAVVAGATESEIWDLDPDEAAAFRDEVGLSEAAPARVGRALVEAAELQVFYTANRAAATAWLLPAGGTALDAAGTIHSDFAARFIRADVAGADEVIEAEGLTALRTAGQLRNVGRDHPLDDRDFLQIHFSR